MNRRMNRTLASLKWSLLSVLAIALLGAIAGEPIQQPAAAASASIAAANS